MSRFGGSFVSVLEQSDRSAVAAWNRQGRQLHEKKSENSTQMSIVPFLFAAKISPSVSRNVLLRLFA